MYPKLGIKFLQSLQGQSIDVQFFPFHLKRETEAVAFISSGIIFHILGPRHLRVSNP